MSLVCRPTTKALIATRPDTSLIFGGGNMTIDQVTLATLAAYGSTTVTLILLPTTLLQSTQ